MQEEFSASVAPDEFQMLSSPKGVVQMWKVSIMTDSSEGQWCSGPALVANTDVCVLTSFLYGKGKLWTICIHLIFPSFHHSNSCQRSGEPVAGGKPQKALHGPPGPSASLAWSCWKDQQDKPTKGGAPQQRGPLLELAHTGCRADGTISTSASTQSSLVLLGDREDDRHGGEKQCKRLLHRSGESREGEKTLSVF